MRIFHLVWNTHSNAQNLCSSKIQKSAWVGFYTKMRGRNNTTSHLWLFHLRLHFNQTLSYKFVHSILLVRAAITLL